ncbi:response regulator transcription factor [Accumulibacter sp.]|uniref:response regulator transcription factor n=1 Tax=Accumulibacter sp. TaxID=2053492 RepID=UPI0028C4385C|nr:response regulator transcription factor [Accumulibacter sp.]
MTRVLLVDDDVELASMLREYLEQEGFEADVVHDGESGVREALSGRYAIVVLDVMMPRLNGVEALRQIRAASRMPVLMLTARGDDIDRIIGLELGADDYVPKPCSPRELVARLRAILRRVTGDAAGGSAEGPLVVGPLSMWPERRSAQWHDQALNLTSTEYSILEVMARHAGRVVSKSELSELALGRPLARFDRSIDVHVSSIRQKLGTRPEGDSWIQTVRGQGYQLVNG